MDPVSQQQRACKRCGLVKDLSEFNFKQRERGIRHPYCRDCGKALTQSHYRHNKQAYLARNARTYARHRELIRQAKSRPCADCGVQYPYYVMDFDHRAGEAKSFELSSVARKTVREIMNEIAKCDVVCSNCHRERTHRRRGF